MFHNPGAPARIQFHYERPADVILQTAHGVWGGINPHGEIEMNFYNESDTPPAVTEQTLEPDGSLGPEPVPGANGAQHITRHIHSRILLNYDTARSLRDWLEDRISELETESPGDIYSIKPGIEQ